MSPDTLDTAVVVRTPDQVCSEMAGEVIIFSPKSGTYYTLDAVGAKIWALVEKPISVGDICATIHQEYDVQLEMCQRDVHNFIDGLKTAGLVQIDETAAG
jgi:hypothetical protein